MTPIVSICCITYNHAPFILQCLDGFLMQRPPSGIPEDAKMSDWCEILIHDDCSTDGTDAIIREYAEKYPDLIFPLYEEENQYSKGIKVDFFNYNRAQGKYIAYCEGDDYWTDPLKLQKQVDFMEAHPEFMICSHDFTTLYQETQKQINNVIQSRAQISFLKEKESAYFPYDYEQFLRYYPAQTATLLCRNIDYHIPAIFKGKIDEYEYYYHLKSGKGVVLKESMSVYRYTGSGVFSNLSHEEQLLKAYQVRKEIYLYEKDPVLKRNLLDMDRNIVGAKIVRKEFGSAFHWFIQSGKIQGIKGSMLILKTIIKSTIRRHNPHKKHT